MVLDLIPLARLLENAASHPKSLKRFACIPKIYVKSVEFNASRQFATKSGIVLHFSNKNVKLKLGSFWLSPVSIPDCTTSSSLPKAQNEK